MRHHVGDRERSIRAASLRSPESSPATLILDDAEPSEDSATGVQSVGIDRRTVLNRSQGQNEPVGTR
jgi:hypothetical protein